VSTVCEHSAAQRLSGLDNAPTFEFPHAPRKTVRGDVMNEAGDLLTGFGRLRPPADVTFAVLSLMCACSRRSAKPHVARHHHRPKGAVGSGRALRLDAIHREQFLLGERVPGSPRGFPIRMNALSIGIENGSTLPDVTRWLRGLGIPCRLVVVEVIGRISSSE
jgi:hypothetical protein